MLQTKLSDLEVSSRGLTEQLDTKEQQLAETTTQCGLLQEELKNTKEKLEKTQETSRTKSTNLAESNKGMIMFYVSCVMVLCMLLNMSQVVE